MPFPLGRLIPESDSITIDFPKDWSPTTIIVGSWIPSCMMLRCLSLSTQSRRGRILSFKDEIIGAWTPETFGSITAICFGSSTCSGYSLEEDPFTILLNIMVTTVWQKMFCDFAARCSLWSLLGYWLINPVLMTTWFIISIFIHVWSLFKVQENRWEGCVKPPTIHLI